MGGVFRMPILVTDDLKNEILSMRKKVFRYMRQHSSKTVFQLHRLALMLQALL